MNDLSVTPMGLDKIKRYGWSDPGTPGRFMMLHKEQLIIPDDSYQRAATSLCSDKKVLKIAAEFSWIAFQILAVAERDGAYYVIDGGHRLRGARRRSDITVLPCMIFDVNGLQEEAKAFDVTNSNRKPMGAVDRHRAHLVAEDPLAATVEGYVRQAGRTVSKNAGPGTVSCINDIKRFINSDEEAFQGAWSVAAELCQGNKLPQSILGGLFYLQRFASEPVTTPRVRKKIIATGFDELARAAQSGAAFFGHRGPDTFAHGMLQAINKGLHKKLEARKAT